MTAIIVSAILFWLACGVVHYGLWVGHFQMEYPVYAKRDRISDRVWGAVGILLGPISLIATLSVCRPYHWEL